MNKIVNVLNGEYEPIRYSKNYVEQIILEKDNEIERLNKECDTYMKIATKRGNIIDEIKEKIDDYFAYDYENESMARLDTINEINHIIIEMKEDKQ